MQGGVSTSIQDTRSPPGSVVIEGVALAQRIDNGNQLTLRIEDIGGRVAERIGDRAGPAVGIVKYRGAVPQGIGDGGGLVAGVISEPDRVAQWISDRGGVILIVVRFQIRATEGVGTGHHIPALIIGVLGRIALAIEDGSSPAGDIILDGRNVPVGIDRPNQAATGIELSAQNRNPARILDLGDEMREARISINIGRGGVNEMTGVGCIREPIGMDKIACAGIIVCDRGGSDRDSVRV